MTDFGYLLILGWDEDFGYFQVFGFLVCCRRGKWVEKVTHWGGLGGFDEESFEIEKYRLCICFIFDSNIFVSAASGSER